MKIKNIFVIPIRFILTAYCFIHFAVLVSWVSKWVIPRAHNISDNLEDQRKYALEVSQSGVRYYLNTLSFCRLIEFKFIGTPLTSPGLIAGNHPSLLDFIVLMIDFPQAVCIYKPQTKHNPILSDFVQSVGYIEGMDGSHSTSKKILHDCCESIRAGLQIVFFPEGTRSKLAIKPDKFRTTLFHSAIKTGAPVQPVAIYCNPLFLGKNQSWLDFSTAKNHMVISYLQPICLNDLPIENQTARGLAYKVQTSIEAELLRLDSL
ncbi:MAG: lysophospholipid acyltransferase family protein [Mariprofundales bacterium]